MKIRGSKILVTGGCGLIGSTTIDLLLRDHDPDKIVIFDNLVRGSTVECRGCVARPSGRAGAGRHPRHRAV